MPHCYSDVLENTAAANDLEMNYGTCLAGFSSSD